MAEIDIDALEQVARDALWTGRWYDGGCETLMAERDGWHEEVAHPIPTGVVPFLSASQPAVVLELVSRLRAAEAELAALREQEPVAYFIDDEDGDREYNTTPRFSFGRVGGTPLYAAPVAQPAVSVPQVAIGKILAEVMDAAVRNGANSVSMPDEYVEVAAWLHEVERSAGVEAKPAVSVPEGWKLVPVEPTPEMLCALIDGANQYDSWNEGYRDMLAAAPEAKP